MSAVELSDVVEALKRQIDGLSPPATLRLAAEMLEARRPDLALALIARVHAELSAVVAREARP